MSKPLQRIDDEKNAPPEWAPGQRKKVHDAWEQVLAVAKDDALLDGLGRFVEKFPEDAPAKDRFDNLRLTKLLPNLSDAKSRKDVTEKIEAARRSAAGLEKQVGEAAWKAFGTELETSQSTRLEQLFHAARDAFLTAIKESSPNLATLKERHREMTETGSLKNSAVTKSFRNILTAATLPEKAKADEAKEKAAAIDLVKDANDPKLKEYHDLFFDRLVILGTDHPRTRETIRSAFSKEAMPVAISKAVKRWEKDSLLDGLSASVKALDSSFTKQPTAAVAQSARNEVKKQLEALAKTDADNHFTKDREDADLRINTAQVWLDSIADKTADLLPKLTAKNCPYPIPLLREAIRQCGLGKLPLDKVRAAKKNVAIPEVVTQEIETEFQAALAKLTWGELKTAKPNASSFFEPTDQALGWRYLSDADNLLDNPKMLPTVEVREKIRAAVKKAQDFTLPNNITRPDQTSFDELIGYLNWAVDFGTIVPAKSANDVIKLVNQSEIWTTPRKTRAAEAIKAAATQVSLREWKEIPFLAQVYDPKTAAPAVTNWLEPAKDWPGMSDPAFASTFALLYDSAGKEKWDEARIAALTATESPKFLPARVRLGILKIDAAKAKKDDKTASKAASEIAWDAIEWLHGEVNKVGADPANWKDLLQTLVHKLPLDPAEKDVRLKAATTRLDILKKLNDVGTDRDDLKTKKTTYIEAFDSAARGSTVGPDKAKYLAWKAYVRYLRLYDKSMVNWSDVSEWQAMWADLDAARKADPICADAAWVRALIRFYGFEDFDPARSKVLFETAKKAGTKNWGDKPDEFAFRLHLFDDCDLALAGLRDRPDGQFRYLTARARFQTVLHYDVDLRREGAASVLSAGLTEVSDALDQKYKEPGLARHLRAMLHEDLAWIGTDEASTAREEFQKAIDGLRELTAPDAVPSLKPEDVLLDLGRVRVRKVLFGAAKWVGDENRDLRSCLAGDGVTDEVKATAHFWLGRIAYQDRDWKGAEDELNKAAKCLPSYRSDRDLYLELAKSRGDYSKMKLKEKVPAAGSERMKFLSSAGNLFGLAADLSSKSNRNDLVEGLDLFPWRMAAADRAKLLLAVAKESAGQAALQARVKKIVDRDASTFGPEAASLIRETVK